MDLIEVLQKIFQGGYEGMKPTDIAFGTVRSLSPFTVRVDESMQDIPEVALVRTVGVMPKSYTGTDSNGDTFTVVINEGLTVGDRVVLMRCSAGQRFLVLSKVY